MARNAVTAYDSKGAFIRLNATVTHDARAPRNPYAMGYGKRIPTNMRANGYRVYAICFSNAATLYIEVRGVSFLFNEVEN